MVRKPKNEHFFKDLRNKIIEIESTNQPSLNEGKLPGLHHLTHLEDLILGEGPNGLARVIKILHACANGSANSETTMKWDGSPAIAFGRDESGQFFLTDKSGYAAKKYDGKATSAKALGQMFAGRNLPLDSDRKQFINKMIGVFDEFKNATPNDFRGVLVGDLLYFATPTIENGVYEFEPNVVTYRVKPDSKVGKRIAQSKIGIVIHNYIGDKFNSTEDAINNIQGSSILVIPPVHVQQASRLNAKAINKLSAYANKHMHLIKKLFDPNALKGIASIHSTMYKYINNKVRQGGLDTLGDDFNDWLRTEKLTDKKHKKFIKYLEKNKEGVHALWALIKATMKLKDCLVVEFDNQVHDVHQSINGQKGGEGYVVNDSGGPIKLVKRDTFSAANFAKNNS